MAKFTPYAVTTLPTAGAIDINGIYFMKQASEEYFTIHIRKNDNSGWLTLADVPVTSVNGMTGAVVLDLALNTTTGVLSLSGSGATINLDSRYTKNSDNIAWSRITGRPTTLAGYGITDAALDANVVHKTGGETIAGTKVFSDAPQVPTPGIPANAANKQYVDTVSNALQTQIDALASSVATGVKQAVPIDCSTNPNYPASVKGDRYRVTAAGRIGGASGPLVAENDVIECINNSAAGTHAAVGANFMIQQANIDSATESVQGYIRKATTPEAVAGSSDVGAMTPLKTQSKIDATAVKFDAAQTLTDPQKAQARTNIGAASAADVEWGQKDW